MNPAAGHEEALSPLQPGDAELLDVLDGRGEAVQGGPAGCAIHPVWFIRDTVKFGLEPSLKFFRIQSSLVPYFVP